MNFFSKFIQLQYSAAVSLHNYSVANGSKTIATHCWTNLSSSIYLNTKKLEI